MIEPSLAAAQDASSPPADATASDLTLPALGETAPLEQGQRAPWAGMLVRDPDLFDLQSGLMVCRFRLASEDRLHAEVLAARERQSDARELAWTQRLELYGGLWRGRVEQLGRELAAAQRAAAREWWESPALWAGIGAAITAAVAIALAIGIGG